MAVPARRTPIARWPAWVGSVRRFLFGAGGGVGSGAGDDGALVVRRADAHPDAPPRRPLSLADLGGIAPPSDLDTPLSAIDPDAIPSVPRAPVRPVAPLASGERLQIFALAVPSAPVAEGDATIDALMRRLGG